MMMIRIAIVYVWGRLSGPAALFLEEATRAETSRQGSKMFASPLLYVGWRERESEREREREGERARERKRDSEAEREQGEKGSERRMALRVIPRGKQRLTVYRAHQVCEFV